MSEIMDLIENRGLKISIREDKINNSMYKCDSCCKDFTDKQTVIEYECECGSNARVCSIECLIKELDYSSFLELRTIDVYPVPNTEKIRQKIEQQVKDMPDNSVLSLSDGKVKVFSYKHEEDFKTTYKVATKINSCVSSTTLYENISYAMLNKIIDALEK